MTTKIVYCFADDCENNENNECTLKATSNNSDGMCNYYKSTLEGEG